jgi:hypothetical protein
MGTVAKDKEWKKGVNEIGRMERNYGRVELGRLGMNRQRNWV